MSFHNNQNSKIQLGFVQTTGGVCRQVWCYSVVQINLREGQRHASTEEIRSELIRRGYPWAKLYPRLRARVIVPDVQRKTLLACNVKEL